MSVSNKNYINLFFPHNEGKWDIKRFFEKQVTYLQGD
jgi:hypothetical protein